MTYYVYTAWTSDDPKGDQPMGSSLEGFPRIQQAQAHIEMVTNGCAAGVSVKCRVITGIELKVNIGKPKYPVEIKEL
jgi:hypothetical protein